MNMFSGGVTSFPPSFIVNQLLDLMVSQRRDVIPKCDSHTNEELLFCETCDKIFCQLCDQHQISAEHTVVPFSLAIKRMYEILSFKASKSTRTVLSFPLHDFCFQQPVVWIMPSNWLIMKFFDWIAVWKKQVCSMILDRECGRIFLSSGSNQSIVQ